MIKMAKHKNDYFKLAEQQVDVYKRQVSVHAESRLQLQLTARYIRRLRLMMSPELSNPTEMPEKALYYK